jgi:hypothetical protein
MNHAGLIEPTADPPRRSDAHEWRAYYRITVLGLRVAGAQATLLSEICASVLSQRHAPSGATS